MKFPRPRLPAIQGKPNALRGCGDGIPRCFRYSARPFYLRIESLEMPRRRLGCLHDLGSVPVAEIISPCGLLRRHALLSPTSSDCSLLDLPRGDMASG
jgi:hypothetical protein